MSLLEPPQEIPMWGLILMWVSSLIGVWLLGWEIYRKL